MKKIFILLTILIVFFVFTSCDSNNINPVFTSCDSNNISSKTEVNNLLDSLITALENNDEAALKNLFALDVQDHPENLYNNSEDLDSQIKKMVDYFAGDVISYEKIKTIAEGEEVRNGKTVYLGVGNAHCDSIVTSEDTYIISFSAILVDDKPENKGIWRIWLGKNDDDHMIVGISDMPLS